MQLVYSKFRRVAAALLPIFLSGIFVSQARAQAIFTTVVNVSPNPVPLGKAVTLSASVQLAGDLARGLVTFEDGKTVIGSAQIVQSSGIASLKVTLGPGTHQITANFRGAAVTPPPNNQTAGTNLTSSSEPLTLTVMGQVATTTTISSTGAAGGYTLTGTVAGVGLLPPTGAVSFTDQTNKNPLGSAVLGAATASLNFQAEQEFGTGGSNSFASGDFNGDGITDLAFVGNVAGTIGVMLGNGDGTFQAQVNFSVGEDPSSVAVGDFNNDGILDLAVANSLDSNIGVMLGNGDGTFQAQQVYGTSDRSVGLAVADFNGDGIADLAVAEGNKSVGVLLGNGDGTFQAEQDFGTGTAPFYVAVGDFNGDGFPDLAVSNSVDNTVSVLLGKGNGTFQTERFFRVGAGPTTIAVADLNGDGFLDLAVENVISLELSVLLGNGDGTFQAQKTAATSVSTVAAGDFNGDGIPDLAVTNVTNSSSVGILLGKGDGTFETQQNYGNSGGALGLVVADFDGNGIPDVAMGDQASGRVGVLLNSLTQSASAELSNVTIPGSGTHQIGASYGGDSYHQASNSGSGIGLTATPVMTSLSLMANQSTITAGQAVTFTASLSVYATGSLTTAGELVTFYSGATVLGTGALNSQGQASLIASALPVGMDSVTAQYSGDGTFTASTSNSVTVTVNSAANFTITPLPPSETVPRGILAAFLLELQSVNGFDGNVTLSCSGGPAGSYCGDLPKTVHVNGKAWAVSGIFFPRSTKAGTYTVTFTGVSGWLTNSATASFTVK